MQAACTGNMALSCFSSSCCIPASVSTHPSAAVSCSHGAPLQGLSIRRASINNATSTEAARRSSLPRSSLHGMPLSSVIERKRGGCSTERQLRPGAGAEPVVRAAVTIGVVKEVKPAAKELFYNVVVTVPEKSEVFKWYRTPGQYVDLLPVSSSSADANSFFIASRVGNVDLEFLIDDAPNTIANELIHSKPGDRVVVANSTQSTGFDTYEMIDAQHVIMVASGYGLGPFRALIETGFKANERKDVILYALYTPDQEPYRDLHPTWQSTGVKIESGLEPSILLKDPSKTVALMLASVVEQEVLTKYFIEKGVPENKILTLFGGISSTDKAYYNKVLQNLKHHPKFPHHGEKHVGLKIKV